jgi:predicted phosphodiesterase
MKRGYCYQCKRRTSHKDEKENWLCTFCDMGLEDKLSPEQENILALVGKSNLTARELKILLNQPKHDKFKNRVYDHSKLGHVKIGILADTHIGHKKFDEGFMKYASEVFRKEGVKNVYHAGDITEGMSGRPGHVYELQYVGFSQQVGAAARIFKQYFSDFQIYGITGNHDQWFKYKGDNGADVGEELQNRLPNFHYIGENEAHVKLGPKANLMLFHPGDGTAYATSYKLQKLAESFTGGEKPNILVEGHYHKAMYMFSRNIHALEGGTLCGQTGWMRGKKIPAHMGFWILELDIGKRGITRFTPHFYPKYD